LTLSEFGPKGAALQEPPTSDRAVLDEHIAGASFRDIGARHGISHERARQVYVREARAHVDKIELDMLACRKSGEAFLLLIPNGPDRTLALDYLSWVVKQLRSRDIAVAVRVHTTTAGLAVELADETEVHA
jgi:hypothetical protein